MKSVKRFLKVFGLVYLGSISITFPVTMYQLTFNKPDWLEVQHGALGGAVAVLLIPLTFGLFNLLGAAFAVYAFTAKK